MSNHTSTRYRHARRSRRSLGPVAIVVLLTATVVHVAGASPAPGPDNPWLQRRVAALAHAGGEDENPQETLFAFGQNVADGVPILDMDVQITADGVPVLMHDNTVDRTTNGTGSIHSMTFAQVHALDAAYWYTADCAACHSEPTDAYLYRGIRTGAKPPPTGYTAADFAVPSLEEVFQRFGDSVYYDIEIKDDAGDVTALAQATADLIHTYGLSSRVVIASFGGPGMPAFRAAAPDVATSATLDEVEDFFVHNVVPQDAQILDIPPTYDLNGVTINVVTPAFVQKAHEAGLAVWVWMNSGSQQNADYYNQLLDMGVDGLNVSRPSVLMQVLAQRGDGWDPTATTTTTTTSLPPTTSSTPTSEPTTTGPSTTTTPASSTTSTEPPRATTTAPSEPTGQAPVARGVTASPTFTG